MKGEIGTNRFVPIAVFGSGYVGLVTGTCFAAAGVELIGVDTPRDEDGHADMQDVLAMARSIGRHMDAPRVVGTKSTVPVGTAGKVSDPIRAEQWAGAWRSPLRWCRTLNSSRRARPWLISRSPTASW